MIAGYEIERSVPALSRCDADVARLLTARWSKSDFEQYAVERGFL